MVAENNLGGPAEGSKSFHTSIENTKQLRERKTHEDPMMVISRSILRLKTPNNCEKQTWHNTND